MKTIKTNSIKAVVTKKTAPKWATNAKKTIKELSKKTDRTQFETLRLVNQMYKIENRSLSKIYRELANPTPEIKNLISEIGKSDFQPLANSKQS